MSRAGSAPRGRWQHRAALVALLFCSAPASAQEPITLVLNIPAYRLDVFEGDARIRSYRVAVGMKAFQTPTGTFALDEITWNPWWIPPPDREWTRGEKPQPPGPRNVMGKVKIRFAEQYYLHGTPYGGSIGSAASHGCVRMRNADAQDLARLLHERFTPEANAAALDSLRKSLATQKYVIPSRPQLAVVYELAEVSGEKLRLYTDVYGRGGLKDAVKAAIAKSGYVPDTVAVEQLIRQDVTGSTSLPLSSFIVPF